MDTTIDLIQSFHYFYFYQGPESGTAEVACQSTLGSSITTGGGFSHTYTLPSWQAAAVSGYFARVSGTSQAPQAGYNPTMRGYPDISALANKYQVVANGMTYIGEIKIRESIISPRSFLTFLLLFLFTTAYTLL